MENQTIQIKKKSRKWLWIIGGIILLIVIISIATGNNEKETLPETAQPQISEPEDTQPQTTQPQETQKKIQKKEMCTCVYRSCSDDSSCDSFCQSMGYDKCGGNECWKQDSRFSSISKFLKYSAENYCQCSGKWDEGQYGQCQSTGSCNLVCSWSGQNCLKAGCGCCKIQIQE